MHCLHPSRPPRSFSMFVKRVKSFATLTGTEILTTREDKPDKDSIFGSMVMMLRVNNGFFSGKKRKPPER